MLQEQNGPKWKDWKWQIHHALTIHQLRPYFNLPVADQRVAEKYPVLVTPYYLSLAKDMWDVNDPIHQQCFPDIRELSEDYEGYTEDPFSELTTNGPIPGVVHRFEDRVLVVAMSFCPVQCRHCTRKNLLKGHSIITKQSLPSVIKYIKSKPQIREVLISGGDPLILSGRELLGLVNAFAELDQIDAVRIGTRIPCTLPMRITPKLAELLGESKKVWINTQFNHSLELTPWSRRACGLLVDAGIPVSNQCVLLAGINDNADELVKLFTGLQKMRVRPYYAFIGDEVKGTSHFRVSEEKAAQLEEEVSERVGGLALPRFVKDRPGQKRKVPVQKHPTE